MTRMRGSSEAYGSWNIICRSRRAMPQRPAAQREDLLAGERDPARVGLLDADDQLAERRLAAAGLADEAERLAGVDVQRHVRRRP